MGREAPPETGRGSQEDDLERRGGEKIFSRASQASTGGLADGIFRGS